MSGTTPPPAPAPVSGSSVGKFHWPSEWTKLLRAAAVAAGGAALTVIASQIDALQSLHPTIWWVVPLGVAVRALMALLSDTRPSSAVKTVLGIGFLGALLVASPAVAGTKTMKDVQGHRYAVDAETQITPGAGSGLGALIGDAIDTTALYIQHDWDLSFGFQGTGSNDDSGEEELAMASLEIAKFFSKNIKLGLELSRPNLAVPEVYAIAPTFQATLFTHPYDSWSKGLRVKLFSWNQAIGENDMLKGGAFSVEWQATAFAAWPVGWGSLQVDAGLKRTFTAMSEDVPDKNSLVAGFRANVWLIR